MSGPGVCRTGNIQKSCRLCAEWQECWKEVYAVVFMDVHYVRSEGRIVKRGLHCLSIDEWEKDVLEWRVEKTSAKFWLSIMNGLKNRGALRIS